MEEGIQLPTEKQQFRVEQFYSKYGLKQRAGIDEDTIVYSGSIKNIDSNARNILENIIIENGTSHVLIVTV